MNEKQKKILSEYLQNASPQETREIYELLALREKSRGSGTPNFQGLNLDVDSMARKMSKKIQEQMGITDVNIRQMAVDMVVRLARQHEPNITNGELQVLLKEMIPSQSENEGRPIPGEILRKMAYQFVKYSQGGATDYDSFNAPQGWVEKYWRLFPNRVRQLITAFLAGIVEDDEFIETLDYILELDSPEPHGGDSRIDGEAKGAKRRRRGEMPSPPGPRKSCG